MSTAIQTELTPAGCGSGLVAPISGGPQVSPQTVELRYVVEWMMGVQRV
jgi:hypothetical protein